MIKEKKILIIKIIYYNYNNNNQFKEINLKEDI